MPQTSKSVIYLTKILIFNEKILTNKLFLAQQIFKIRHRKMWSDPEQQICSRLFFFSNTY